MSWERLGKEQRVMTGDKEGVVRGPGGEKGRDPRTHVDGLNPSPTRRSSGLPLFEDQVEQ